MNRSLPALFALASWLALISAASLDAAAGPNVLFVASDDMRPQLGCYGDPTVKSPHLDALAKRGMAFGRSYVQQALCSPSRTSMLSGRYPATTGIFEIGRPLRATMPDITTPPQHFKNQGYHTRSLSKVYHVGIDDDAPWTIPAWHSQMPRYGPISRAAIEAKPKDDEAKGIRRQGRTKGAGNYAGPAFEIVDCGDEYLLDGDTASNSIAQVREHAELPDHRSAADETRPRELYDMARDPQNDLNVADKPEYAELRHSLSKRLRERFPVQDYQPPPARKK